MHILPHLNGCTIIRLREIDLSNSIGIASRRVGLPLTFIRVGVHGTVVMIFARLINKGGANDNFSRKPVNRRQRVKFKRSHIHLGQFLADGNQFLLSGRGVRHEGG